MRCFRCSREQDENSNFCSNCGADLRGQQEPQEPQNPQQQEPQNQQQQEQQNPQYQQQQFPPQYYSGQPYNQPPQGYSPYNQGQYGQYGQFPPPYNMEANDAISKATTSMILGIIGIVTFFLCCIGIFLAIPGLIIGVNAKKTLNRVNVQQGQGQAIAGIVLSSITVGIATIYLFIFMLASCL